MSRFQVTYNQYYKEDTKELEAFKRDLLTLIASNLLYAIDLHQLAYKKDKLIIKGD